MATPICFSLLKHLLRCACVLARARAGRSKPARMAMMAITTNSSMSVNASRGERRVALLVVMG
jgi:hypothetical protein